MNIHVKQILEQLDLDASTENINQAISEFDLKDKNIISLYLGFSGSSLDETSIAQELNISVDQVTQTINSFINSLKQKGVQPFSNEDKASKLTQSFIEEKKISSKIYQVEIDELYASLIALVGAKEAGALYNNKISPFLKTKVISHDYNFQTQRKLIADYQNSQDTNILVILIERNKKLISKIASKYTHFMEFEDLYQEGVIGFTKGINKFDLTKNTALSTYVSYWIEQGITRYIHNHNRTIRIPVNKEVELRKIKNFQNSYFTKFNREASIEEIAEHLGKSVDFITKLLSLSSIDYLDQPLKDDSANTKGEMIADNRHDEFESIYQNDLKEAVQEALSTIPPRQKEVLIYRFGLDGNERKTLEEIGQKLNLTRERVRQLEKKALAKLKKTNLKYYLEDIDQNNVDQKKQSIVDSLYEGIMPLQKYSFLVLELVFENLEPAEQEILKKNQFATSYDYKNALSRNSKLAKIIDKIRFQASILQPLYDQGVNRVALQNYLKNYQQYCKTIWEYLYPFSKEDVQLALRLQKATAQKNLKRFFGNDFNKICDINYLNKIQQKIAIRALTNIYNDLTEEKIRSHLSFYEQIFLQSCDVTEYIAAQTNLLTAAICTLSSSLFFQNAKSPEQLAEIFNISLSDVKNILESGKIILSDYLKKQEIKVKSLQKEL